MLLHPLDFTRERSTPLAYEEAICAKLFWQVFARSIDAKCRNQYSLAADLCPDDPFCKSFSECLLP